MLKTAASCSASPTCAPTRDGDQDPSAVGEISSFYVRRSRWRHGVGRQLMTACLHTLDEPGYARATLWVLEGNHRAIDFYQATGWYPDGEIKHDEIGGTPIRDLRYQNSLPGTNERHQSSPS